MYSACNSLTSRHKITLDGLTCCKNQSIIIPKEKSHEYSYDILNPESIPKQVDILPPKLVNRKVY